MHVSPCAIAAIEDRDSGVLDLIPKRIFEIEIENLPTPVDGKTDRI